MASLLKMLNPAVSAYKDRRFDGDQEDYERALRTSATVYVGNLSFSTREEQLYEVFSKAGMVKKVIMGLDKYQKTACGFCFVIYYRQQDADACVKYISGTRLDDRPVRVDHDWGFQEDRRYGRGRSGGQVRDEYRQDFDEGRGGWGKQISQQMMYNMMFQENALALEGDGDTYREPAPPPGDPVGGSDRPLPGGVPDPCGDKVAPAEELKEEESLEGDESGPRQKRPRVTSEDGPAVQEAPAADNGVVVEEEGGEDGVEGVVVKDEEELVTMEEGE